MSAFLYNLREHLRLVDLLDIGVVAVLLYFCLHWLRRRSSRSLLVAIVTVTALFLLARALKMYLLSQVFQVGLSVIALGLILVFQEDIRRAFERLARWRFGSPAGDQDAAGATLDMLVETVSLLAESRTGALIVVQGRQAPDRYLRGGVAVDGQVSIPLLLSIFDTSSPGHDGAVLVEGDRLVRMGVHLPLSENMEQIGHRGTRHAAALGLAECTDALVIVTSEEQGTVSVAEGGRLETLSGPAELTERLDRFAGPLDSHSLGGAVRNLFTRELALKLVSLLAAIGLWLALAYRVERVQRTFPVPVEIRNLPAGLELAEPKPQVAWVTLSGTEREFAMIQPDRLVISLDLGAAREGPLDITLSSAHLNNPPGITVEVFNPDVLSLYLHRYVRREVPVRARTANLPPHLSIAGVEVRPSRVAVRVPRDRADALALTGLSTRVIDLSSITGPRELSLSVELVVDQTLQLPQNAPTSVQVVLRIVERE